MYKVKSRVLENKEIAEGYFRLSLESPEVARNAWPGRFVMVRVGNSYDPLLRRPFSIHKIIKSRVKDQEREVFQPSGIEILYKVVGKGTDMMACMKEGDFVDTVGPLGNGFSFPEGLKGAIVVGGGIGAAPLHALVEEMIKDQERKIVVFLGGRTKRDILCQDEFRRLGADVQIATDDGSLGHKGLVTELLEKYLSISDSRFTVHDLSIFSCGPFLMSKKIAEISKGCKIPCQVSLEAHMACGIGACLGCVVRVKESAGANGRSPLQEQEPVTSCKLSDTVSCGCDSEYVPCGNQLPEAGYKRVCMEGPVFDAEEVLWD